MINGYDWLRYVILTNAKKILKNRYARFYVTLRVMLSYDTLVVALFIGAVAWEITVRDFGSPVKIEQLPSTFAVVLSKRLRVFKMPQ